MPALAGRQVVGFGGRWAAGARWSSPETKKCPKSVHGTLFASGAAKNRKNQPKTAPLAGRFQTDPTKVSNLDTFSGHNFGLRSVVYLLRVRARVSWSSLNSELGWHINVCIFDLCFLHTSGGPGAGASGHCQRSASVGALRSPFFLSLVVFPTLHPPRGPSGGLVLQIQAGDHHDVSV